MKLFSTIAALLGTGSMMTIVIRKNNDGRLTVSTALNNENLQDEAKKHIVPFLVSGTPDELDEGYVEAIGEPMETSKGLQTSMANFEAQQKVAQANSAAAKAKKAEEDKAKNDRDKKVKDLTAKADALLKEKKYKEAKVLLSQALPLATGTAKNDIQKKIDLCKTQDAPDLFGSFDEEPEAPAAESPEASAPESESPEASPSESDEPEEVGIEFAEED